MGSPLATTMPAEPSTALVRFDRTQRVLHWTNAALFIVLIVTGAVLYGAPGTQWVGRRDLVKQLHVLVGLALPIPVLLAVAASAQLRLDLRRCARWIADDTAWWSRRARRKGRVRLGKFNPGQKLNTMFVGASIVVMLGTGAVMRWPDPFRDSWRTGATAVHDWNAWALGIVVIGHIAVALADPEALRSMWSGTVSRAWARSHAPRWHDESPD